MQLSHVILAPDSFKGSLTAAAACDAMRAGVLRAAPLCRVSAVPMADGGEGTVNAYLSACGGTRCHATVRGPYFEEVTAAYGILPDGTAVLETASCAGLGLAAGRENPMLTTTYGLGELMLHAARNGARRILVGLGGSATNDGGAGAAAAAGIRFFDAQDQELLPVGGTLCDIARIDMSGRSPLLDGVEIVAICDVENPLVGPDGASAVYAPQKGATPEMVTLLDEGLGALADVIAETCGMLLHHAPGAGAAGGLGGGMTAFFGAKRKSGIDAVLDAASFDRQLADCNLVLTGEGRFDGQSMCGKVVSGLAARTARRGVPLVVLAGSACDVTDAVYAAGITAVVPILRTPGALAEQLPHAAENLALTTETVLRLLIER